MLSAYQSPFIATALRLARWCLLGWYDFVLQYRRTLIGPLWQVAEVGLWAGGLVLIFGRFHDKDPNYFLYVLSGLIVWNAISSVISAGTGVFTSNSTLILNIPNPLLLYVVRTFTLISLRFALQILVYVIVAIFYRIPLSFAVVMTIPSLIVLFIFSVSTMMVLGIIGARFRDFGPLISATMRFLFFVTPVFWVPAPGTAQSFLATINPLAYLVDLVRKPLLGQFPSLGAIFVGIAISLISVIAAAAVHKLYRRLVPIWL